MLTNGKIKLSKLERSHRQEFSQIANNREIWVNLRDVFPHPYSKKDADQFIDFISQESPQLTFGIFYRDHIAGVIGLSPFSDINRVKAEVGFWLGKPYWGKGIATSALQLICDYAFNDLRLIRLEALVFDYNEASIRVLEKNGFNLDAKLEKSSIKME
ncbi:MAG: GNAT family N-acetyltransferase [Balneolaceae bacterium]|nr:GNAT family N-acetyltransferase [Balneolaceae bacterium]MBO6546633.1 GNAT family N-acetyltransferase [Balneolaceae bacterium]MBO6648991.1 GNAT family N-acetyltransferase [Balneolaceae bacterium]